MYADLVHDKQLLIWLLDRQHTIDNPKTAILRADMHEAGPEAQQSYRVFAEHYGF